MLWLLRFASGTTQVGRDILPGFPGPFGGTFAMSGIKDIRLHFFLAGELDKTPSAWRDY